ncbi:unnamed protein product, partial [Sphacelaria rigidula]
EVAATAAEGEEGELLAPDGSVVNRTHIAMLIIRLLAQQQLFSAFMEPVDLVAYPSYGVMIKRPMDLQTMYHRVEKGVFGGLRGRRRPPVPAPPQPRPVAVAATPAPTPAT